MNKFLYIIFTSLLLASCARVGSPSGGAKDSKPPVFIRSNIDSPRVNVSRNLRELRLDFDEYITLKDINKNLIISPPIKKIKKILPSNLANKYVLIQWEDDLEENTTYSFNFGNAIVDNNEANGLPYFNYAFSTGSFLDSLYVSGTVKNALAVKKENSTKIKNGVVGLYKVSDSINYKAKPDYISRIEDDGYFEINYLPQGQYSVVAFEDENQNSVFDQGKEKIAFLKEYISLEQKISGLDMKLYPSVKKQSYKEIKGIPGGLLLLFEGNPETVEIFPLKDQLKSYETYHRKHSDSAFVWFNAKENNVGLEFGSQLEFHYKTKAKEDTVSIFYKNDPKHELTISRQDSKGFPLGKDLVLKANMPIKNILADKMTLESDSIPQKFSAKINEKNDREILINSEFALGKKYTLNISKESVSSFYETNPKAYAFNFEVDKPDSFGNFMVRLKNKPNSKFWVQLLNENNDVQYSQYTQLDEIKFENLKPTNYYLRIIIDENSNELWDLVDFDNQTFAEPVLIFDKVISVRQKWDIVEDWDLEQNK